MSERILPILLLACLLTSTSPAQVLRENPEQPPRAPSAAKASAVKPCFQPGALMIPLGESRSARLTGTPVGAAPVLEVGSPEVARASYRSGVLSVSGLAPGQTAVTVRFPERELRLPVEVRPWAVRLPERLEIRWNGEPPDRALYSEMLRTLLLSAGDLHARAKLTVEYKELPKPGAAASHQVKIEAAGPGLLPVSREVTVSVRPEAVSLTSAEALVVSNRPERVAGTGYLLQRTLPPGAVRLLYHHRNEPGHPERQLEVVLSNPCSEPQRVLLVLASVGPSEDEIYAGHEATRRFVRRVVGRQGLVLTLPARGSLTIDRLRMKPGQTVSGMALLQPLDEGTLELGIRAVAESDPFPEAVSSGELEAGEGRTARGIFPPVVESRHSHVLGGPFTYVPLGDEPFLRDPDTGEIGYGNFGVVHRILVELYNPDPEPRDAWVEFVPGGGPARGVLFLEDRLIEAAMARAHQTIRLGDWTLEPGETRWVTVETFPQSGSNYPVRLVFKSQFQGRSAAGKPHPGPEDWPRYLP
ncbi:MAG: hypothetical protein HY319_17370 [Armatimonadetes bacterium]|nr:hypothetical protein [Armatimonadota bacterium]